MNIVTIELPIYDLDLVVIIDNWKEASKKFKLAFKDEDYLVCAWTLYDEPYLSGNEIFLLLKPEFLDAGTLCHELVHCISGICKLRGIQISIDNDEPIAYLQGYVGEKVFEFRDKYLEKQKKLLPL